MHTAAGAAVVTFKLGLRSWPAKRMYKERGKCPRTSGGDVRGLISGRGRCPCGRCPAGKCPFPVSTHLIIHLSAHLCHHHRSRHPPLLHAFSKNLSHLSRLLLLPWTAFTITGLDRSYHASRFILSSFFFNFSVCPVWWTKLTTRQLFTAR